jgi:hypothetical protein
MPCSAWFCSLIFHATPHILPPEVVFIIFILLSACLLPRDKVPYESFSGRKPNATMSGAEAALLGVGILCNAMQILTFAKDSIHVYRNIRDGRAPDPKLDSYPKNAKACFNEMNQTAAQIEPLGQTQQQIVDGKKVHDCVDELQQQFAKLYVDEPSKRGLCGRVAALKGLRQDVGHNFVNVPSSCWGLMEAPYGPRPRLDSINQWLNVVCWMQTQQGNNVETKRVYIIFMYGSLFLEC